MRRLALCALCCCLPGLLSAYSYEGHRWAGSAATYYGRDTHVPYLVNLDSCASMGLDQSRVLADIQTAASAWHEQTNADFEWVYSGLTDRVGLSVDGQNTVSCMPGWTGYLSNVQWHYGANGYLDDFDIQIWVGPVPWFTSDQSCAQGTYILDILIHEFGHGLVLGHSTDPNATMYSPANYCDTYPRTLYTDDINAIEAIYGMRGPSGLTDDEGAVWSISPPNVILRNGVPANRGLGYDICRTGATVSVYGIDSNWWRWVDSGWVNTGPSRPC